VTVTRREVTVPRPGSRRNVNSWKPSQMESLLPTPAERLLNRQRGAAPISPGVGERTLVEQHGEARIAAAHPKSASQDC